MDVTGDDELGELAKNGEVINLMANFGETSVLQVELTFCLRYLFFHSCHQTENNPISSHVRGHFKT